MSKSSAHKAKETLKRGFDWELIKQLYQFSRPYSRFILGSVSFVPLVALFHLIQPLFVREAIDKYILSGTTKGIWIVSILFLTALSLEFVSRYFQIYFIELSGQKINYYLRKKVFSFIQSRSLKFFDKRPVGRLVTRLTTDIEHISDLFSSGVITLFSDLFVLIGIIVIMLCLNVKLALTALTVIPILIVVAILFRILSRRIYRVIRARLSKMNSHTQESILGMSVIQLFVQERKMADKFLTIHSDHRKAQFLSNVYESVFYASVELLSTFTLALVLWRGTGSIIENTLTFGTLVAFIDYVYKFFVPIRDLSNKLSIIQSSFASCERVFALLKNEDKISEIDTPKQSDKSKGNIRFEKVDFEYFPGQNVLKEISFEIKAGEKVAIVGATGSGKTTLIKLLNRSYDVTQGSITVDNIPIKELPLADLRRKVGVVLQDISLFSSSIERNIKLGFPHISDNQMEEAAKAVRADYFINRLTNKYQHTITEGGTNLSHGERQLISFARVLAYDPEILILDEATSSVDTETEKWIQEALHQIMEGRTSIIIAHRLSTIRDVDRILVLHRGELVESGSHSELMENKGIYKKLYDLQFKPQEETPEIAHFIADEDKEITPEFIED